jgi:hypothetical protein
MEYHWVWMQHRGADSTTEPKQAECVRTLKGRALPCTSHSGEIALAGLRRLRFTLAAAPVLFAHAVVTEMKTSTGSCSPVWHGIN